MVFHVVAGGEESVSGGMKVAFISGTSIVNTDLFKAWDVKTIETKIDKGLEKPASAGRRLL